MLARTRLKLKNAESSINFMQEQHAKTLEDLHKEIEKLQKKNASMHDSQLCMVYTVTGPFCYNRIVFSTDDGRNENHSRY